MEGVGYLVVWSMWVGGIVFEYVVECWVSYIVGGEVGYKLWNGFEGNRVE